LDRASLTSFLTAASRRRLSVLLFAETPLALNILFGAAVLMLLAGTLLISANWLLLAAFAGATVAGLRIRKRWLDRYRLAQILDHRLQLNDSLSTAWFLLTESQRPEAAAEYQIQGAEELVATVDPRQAFPFEWQRTWVTPAALSVVVLTLFALRFSRSDTLDLRPSLLPFRFEDLLARGAAEARERERIPKDSNQRDADRNKRPNAPGIPPGERTNDQQTVQSADGQTAASAAANGLTQESAIQKLQQQLASEQQKDASPGLLNRMQDAMGGMMAKLQQALKPKDPRAQKDSQSGEKSQDDEKNAQSGENANSKTSSQQGNSAQDQHGDANGQPTSAQAQAVEKSTNASQLGNANQPAHESGDNSQSGAGRNDGRKEMREAEQLKALGKLEEIVGKRSAAVTGDVTVEKPSGKQQLRTEYSNQLGDHSDLGGEINRDEIPPEYRAYIRAYMDAMHKQAAAPK
jgi:hypothetical protein